MIKGGYIDAHTHMFPVEVMDHWDDYAARDAYFKLLTGNAPGKRVVEVFCTPEQALEQMDKAGVETIVMQGWYWNDPGLMREHNDYMHEVVNGYPGRFAAYASINPALGRDALRELSRIQSMNFKGVGELGPGGNQFPLDHPVLLEICEACEAAGLPINFHVGEPVGHVYEGKDLTPIEGYYHMARRFPDLKLVLAHLGGGLPYYELYDEVHQAFGNVYYDLAALPLLYDVSKSVQALVKLVGPKRVLFGTDFPLTIYPWITTELEISLLAQDITANAGLTEYEYQRVMRENTLELLQGAGTRPGAR